MVDCFYFRSIFMVLTGVITIVSLSSRVPRSLPLTCIAHVEDFSKGPAVRFIVFDSFYYISFPQLLQSVLR